jgi:hypothetical protein
MAVAPKATVESSSGIISSIDFCIVGAILVSSMMSFFIQKSTYVNARRIYALVEFDLPHVASFMTSVVNFYYTSF